MAHAQKPDFVFRRNGRVHLNRQGSQFSRLLAAEVCASAVVMLDTPCSEVVWRVLATHSMRHFPLHFSSRASPCAITFELDSTTPSQAAPLFYFIWMTPCFFIIFILYLFFVVVGTVVCLFVYFLSCPLCCLVWYVKYFLLSRQILCILFFRIWLFRFNSSFASACGLKCGFLFIHNLWAVL